MTDIDEQIDKLPMHEMTGEEMEKSINPNSLKARLLRKEIRYKLYCLKSQAEKDVIIPDNITEEFKEHYSSQPNFDGWENFSVNWDVETYDPTIIIHRLFSEEEEWHRVVMAKFPQIQPDGSLKYPDLRVKEAVEKEAKLQLKDKDLQKKKKAKKRK